jgi:hypothetical protein
VKTSISRPRAVRVRDHLPQVAAPAAGVELLARHARVEVAVREAAEPRPVVDALERGPPAAVGNQDEAAAPVIQRDQLVRADGVEDRKRLHRPDAHVALVDDELRTPPLLRGERHRALLRIRGGRR